MARVVLGSEEARRASSCCVIASCSARHTSKTNWSAVTPWLEKWASETRCIPKYAARRSRGSSRLGFIAVVPTGAKICIRIKPRHLTRPVAKVH